MRAATTTSSGVTAVGKAVAAKAVAGKASPPGRVPPAGTTPAGTPSAGTTPPEATPAATTSVVATAPAAPVPTTAAASPPSPALPDGDYLIVGTDAFPVSGVFCDVLVPGAAPGSVDGEIREIDGTAEGLGPFFYVTDSSGFAGGSRGRGLFSVSSTAGNGTVFFRAGDLVVDAPLVGPAVLLNGKGTLDPDNTLGAYLAALDSAIGADRMAEIRAGAAPTAAEQARILQLHDQYYSTPFSLSVTC